MKNREKKLKFIDEILFPQLKGNGSGIGDYIIYLENRIETLTLFLELQSIEIKQLKNKKL